MSLQALCFAVVVKLKKKDKINVSSRDVLKRINLIIRFSFGSCDRVTPKPMLGHQ